jgi:hypothetical protein
MLIIRNSQKTFIKPFLFLVISLFFQPLQAQNPVRQDTLVKLSKGSFVQERDRKTFISKDTLIRIPASLVPAEISRKEKTIAFYDSIKAKASKNFISRTFFDLIIISPDSTDRKKIITKSDDNYKEYSSKKIRKIEIQRLNVFGANIQNPSYFNPQGFQKFLNKTHINTRENIIRKNLLFVEGDILSPLTLSDNERILRLLPYIDDARIIVVPVSEQEADILVITKDVYSLGANYDYKGLNKGSFWLFEKNLFGAGHDFEVEFPYNLKSSDSPGLGLIYKVNNISKSFINLNLNFYNGLGKRNYGISLSRSLVSSTTKYSGGISIMTEDLDTLINPEPFKHNLQDYWLARSFLINKESVSRIVLGARYLNNNVFERPLINPNSYHALQQYRLFLGSISLSVQKYYKTNLIYGYGRTEDIPYGGLVSLTMGSEYNEFKNRFYGAADISFGRSYENVGYFYTTAGYGTFVKNNHTDQGVLLMRMKYFSNLINMGKFMIRNFVNIDYTRGFDRYTDEYLQVEKENWVSGFKNDSLRGAQRVAIGLESVVFSNRNIYGFRFALFCFANMAFLAGTNQVLSNGNILSGLGLGIRIRNDNLVFNTFQIKLGFFPNPPLYSSISYLTFSGEQLLRPNNFDPGPPSLIPYK